MKRPRIRVASRCGVGAAFLSVGFLTFSQPLTAATATANLVVSATVISACVVTPGVLAFGVYDPTAAGNLDQTGTFTVACTSGTSVTVGLNGGGNLSGSTRRMANLLATEFLPYELYRDSGRTNVWGNTSGTWVSLSATLLPQVLTVYGRIAPAQDVSLGAFTDNVTITVTF